MQLMVQQLGGSVVAAGQSVQARVNALHVFGFKRPGQSQRDQGVPGRAAHGGDVAQAARQGFVPDLLGRRFRREVNAGNDGIGFEQHPAIGESEVQDGTVIPRAQDGGGVLRQRGG